MGLNDIHLTENLHLNSTPKTLCFLVYFRVCVSREVNFCLETINSRTPIQSYIATLTSKEFPVNLFAFF